MGSASKDSQTSDEIRSYTEFAIKRGRIFKTLIGDGLQQTSHQRISNRGGSS